MSNITNATLEVITETVTEIVTEHVPGIEPYAGWVTFFAMLAVLFPPWFQSREQEVPRPEFYSRIRDIVPFAPPMIVFPLVWIGLYILIATTIGLWVVSRLDFPESTEYHATWVLIALNIIFSKLWEPLFFEFRQPIVAAADAVLIFGTSIAIYVLFFVDGGSSIAVYVLWPFYMAWLLFAVVLSIAIAINSEKLGGGRFGMLDYN